MELSKCDKERGGGLAPDEVLGVAGTGQPCSSIPQMLHLAVAGATYPRKAKILCK